MLIYIYYCAIIDSCHEPLLAPLLLTRHAATLTLRFRHEITSHMMRRQHAAFATL